MIFQESIYLSKPGLHLRQSGKGGSQAASKGEVIVNPTHVIVAAVAANKRQNQLIQKGSFLRRASFFHRLNL